MASDWCEIYVKGAEDVGALVPVVAATARGRIDDRSVTSPGRHRDLRRDQLNESEV
jgi:hypothetical protein